MTASQIATADQVASAPALAPSSRAASRVVVLGCGGLGVPAAWTLAAAGIGTLVLVDDDSVERSNLHRQVLYRDADVGRPKVDALAMALVDRFPGLRVEAVAERPRGADALLPLLDGAHGLFEGTDDATQKFAASDALVALRSAGRPVGVIAAAIGRRGQWFGQLPDGPCFRCLFEQPPPPALVQSCVVAGVLGPSVLEVGAWAARSLLRLLASDPDVAASALVRRDGLGFAQTRVQIAADCACHVSTAPIRTP